MGEKYAVQIKARVVTDQASIDAAYKEIADTLNKSVSELKEQQKVTANIKQLNGETVRTIIQGNTLSKQTTYSNNELYNLKKQIAKKTEEIERKLKQVNEAEYGIKMSAKDELAIRQKLDSLKSVNIANEKDVNVLKNYNNELKDLSDQFKNASKESEGFGDKIKQSLASLVSWAAIIKSIKYAVDTVVELDSALTELNKVTDISADQLKTLTQRAYEVGNNIAHTGKEVIEATTEFAKMGYSIDDSLKLGELALLYTNIADEEVSAGEAASFMISQMKAFNITANDSIHIIDAINAVSNKYAVSSADLASSIGAVSATLAESGTSYEETLGLLTSIVEITRDADKASTALKTISQRLRGVGEDGENYVGKLQEAFDKLNIDVQIVKANGAMESTYNILTALSSRWDDLTDAQRQNIGELAAGKNRITEFNALMSNFETAMKATETAVNSAGSAMKENEAYLDSIEGKWNSLMSQLQKMVTEGSLGDIIKDVLDLSKSILELTEALGGLKVVLTGIVTLKVLKAVGGTTGILGGVQKITTGVKALGVALGGLSAPIAAVTALLGTLFVVAQKTNEIPKQMAQNIAELQDEIDKNAEDIGDINTQLEKNKKQIEEINKNPLDIIDSQTLVTLQKENEELERQKKALDAINKVNREKQAKEAYGLLTRSYAQGVGVANAYDPSMAGVDVGKVLRPSGFEAYSYGGQKISFEEYKKILDDPIESTKALIEANKNLRSEIDSLDKSDKNYDNDLTLLNSKLAYNNDLLTVRMTRFQENKDKLDLTIPAHKELSDSISELQDSYAELVNVQKDSETSFETFNDIFSTATEQQVEKMKELSSAGKLTASTFKTEFPNIATEFQKLADKGGYSFDEIIKKIKETIQTTNEIGDVTATAINNLLQKIDSLSGTYKDVSAAIKEYQEHGELSASTLATMMAKYPTYLEALNKEGWSLKTLNKSLKENAQAHLAAAKAANEQALQQSLGANVTIEVAKAALELNKQLLTQTALYPMTQQQSQNIQNLESTVTQYEKMAQQIADLEKSLKTFSYDTTKKSSTTDTWKQAFETEYNALKHQLSMNEITEQEYTDRLEALYKKYFANRKKYLTEYSKYEEEVYKNRQSLFKDEVSTVEHQIELLSHQQGSELEQINFYKQLQDKIHKQAEYYRSLGEEQNKEAIQELQKQWWTYADAIESLYDSMADSYEEMLQSQIDAQQKQIDKLNNVASVAQTVIDEEIDRLTAEKEALEATNDAKEKEIELEKLRNNLFNARNQKNMRVYYAGIGWQWEANKKDIQEAEKALDDFENKQRISKIDDEIKELNTLKSEWSNVADAYEKQQNRIEASLTMGNNFESDVLNKRLSTLRDFVKQYNSEMSKLTTAEKELEEEQKDRTTKSQTKKKNVYYDKNIDYQALINEALARGASRSELARLEEKRNAKIRGEELDYEETHYYTKGYSSGGVVDYTGLARMHGTNARPELVLNNSQAASLYSMIKTMSQPATQTKIGFGTTNNSSNTYNINMYEVDNMNKFMNEFKQYILTHKKLI